jgi:hypothetical protein
VLRSKTSAGFCGVVVGAGAVALVVLVVAVWVETGALRAEMGAMLVSPML